MKKYFSICILTLFAVLMLGGSAFAAASLNGGNATVAAELISTTVAYALPATAANTGYQPAGAVAKSSQLKFTLSGGKFSTTPTGYNLCDFSSATKKKATAVAGTALGDSNASVTLTLTSALASGTVYTLQSDDCATNYNPLGAAVLINAGSTGGTVVTMTVDNALSAGDGNIYATGTIATVTNGLSATLLTSATDTIDFSATPTMTKFKTGGSGTTTTSVAAVVIQNNTTLGSPVTLTGQSSTNCVAWSATTTTDFLTFTVTPGTTGGTMGTGFATTGAYTIVPYKAGIAQTTQTIATSITSTGTSASGDLTLNTTTAFCGASAASTLLSTAKMNNVLTVGGTVALTERTYKLALATKAGATLKAAARTLLSATTAWTWSLDSTQYYIPLIKYGTGVETYIKLQAKNTTTSSPGVSLQVLATDGTMVTVTPTTANITAGTPWTISGTEISALVTAAGKSVDGAKGFAVIATVNAPNADVFGYANIVNSAGEKRVPCQRVTTVSAGAGWTTIAE